MKQYLIFLLLATFFSFSIACKENDETDVETNEIRVTPEGTTLMKPNDTLQFQATGRPLTWTVASAGQFKISSNENGGGLSYIAPNEAGIYEIKVFNSRDTVTRKVIVTPHAELFKAMQKGNYIMYFRHMNAASGVDNFTSTVPNWWKSCDSTIARQLSPPGYPQAAQTGKAMKNLELPIAKIISSEYCRCIKSAENLNLNVPIETSQALTYYVYDEPNRFKNSIALAETQPVNDKLIILMGHSFTTGESTAPSLQMGDAAVYKQLSGNKVEFVKIIKTTDWTALK